MKIYKIKFLAFLLVILFCASCSVVNTQVSTKSLSSSEDRLVQAPLVAELGVKTPTKVTQNQEVTKIMRKKLSEQQIKELVISSALEQSLGDVMIEPRFSLTHNKRGHLKEVGVSGYAACYETFRQFEAKDTLYFGTLKSQNTLASANKKSQKTGSFIPNLSSGLIGKLPSSKSLRSVEKLEKYVPYNGFTLSAKATLLFYDQIEYVFNGWGFSLGYKFSGRFIAGLDYSFTITEYEDYEDYNKEVFAHSVAAFFQYNVLKTRLTPFVKAIAGYQYLIQNYDESITGNKFYWTLQAGAQLNMGRHYLSAGVGVSPLYQCAYGNAYEGFYTKDFGVSLTFSYGVTMGKRSK